MNALFAGGTVALSRFRLVALASVLLAGCDLPGRPQIADRPVPADQVIDFAALYAQNCAGCHGADGERGPAPPLKNALFRAIVPEDELKNVITKGRDKTLMPAFSKENGGALTAAQIEVLVKEIKGVPYKIVQKPAGGVAKIEIVADARGIAPKWGTPATPGDVPAYRAAANGAGDATKGAAAFARACAGCHGNDGQGTDDVGAINDRVFLALLSDQALRRYIITGRPDLGMPGYAERPDSWHFVPLTEPDVTDLVALLASWRKEK
jgi:cytochrome c oxidase cbb3-type subunit III